MFTSEDSGFGCLAASSRRAESLSALAASTGPNTLAANRRLFAFFELALELLAMVIVVYDGGSINCEVVVCEYIERGDECHLNIGTLKIELNEKKRCGGGRQEWMLWRC